MTTWMISGVLGFVSGGALIWFCKDTILRWYKGAEDFAGQLDDQARALRQRLK